MVKVGMYSNAVAANWPWPDSNKAPTFDELFKLQEKLKPIANGSVRMTLAMFEKLKEVVEMREEKQIIGRVGGLNVMVGYCNCSHFVAHGWCMHP